ncbi:hypothetical protein [Pandoraea horticolens]|nr:hypothetical protein [Pandoraea horticolens]
MRLNIATAVLVLSLSSGVSFGNDSPAQSKLSTESGKTLSSNKLSSAQPKISTEMVRQIIRNKNIDPDSPQGLRLATFLVRFFNDPQALAGKTGLSGPTIAPEARLRILRLMSKVMSFGQEACGLSRRTPDVAELTRTLSPEEFNANIALVEAMTLNVPTSPDEHYPLADRVSANATVNEAALDAVGRSNLEKMPTQAQLCSAMTEVFAKLDKMPEPEQRRLTFEIFQLLQGRPGAPELVMADPEAYLNLVFDERQLSPRILSRLPKDGSRPLPFKRIVIEGAWVSEIEGESGPVRETFVNRRNNGVVAEWLESSGEQADNASITFALTYGIENLRGQTILKGGAYRLANLRTPPLDLTNISAIPGKTFRYALSEPELNSDYLPEHQCEIVGSHPASEISSSLEGNAIELLCVVPRRNKGLPATNRSVLLQHYGIALNLGWTVDDKSGKYVITKAAVE